VESPEATVVLENIDRLSPAMQHRVAIWLESGMFVRGGGMTQRPALARLVATSGADLHALVARGSFRDDLLVRLLPARIALPALRDRPEDVAILARAFLARLGGDGPRDLDGDALRVLLRHDWPGNLREMRALLSRAAVTARGRAVGAAARAAAMRPAGSVPMPAPLDERSWILDGLRRNRFRRGETAAFLGISRKTLYNRMRQLGFEA
jgi:DNA-binding NtrC family response regulator